MTRKSLQRNIAEIPKNSKRVKGAVYTEELKERYLWMHAWIDNKCISVNVHVPKIYFVEVLWNKIGLQSVIWQIDPLHQYLE